MPSYVEELQERAQRARRLAKSVTGDPMELRLLDYARELEASAKSRRHSLLQAEGPSGRPKRADQG